MTTPISIRLDDDLDGRLQELVKASGRSKAQIIRDCISDKLEDWEDIYLSLRRLEKKEKMWSQEEINKRYGMEA